MTESYYVYLDFLIAENIHFHSYVTHRETRLLEDITFYSGWLACSSLMMYPHLPEPAMQQFDYMQYILRDPYAPAPPAMARRDVDIMLMIILIIWYQRRHIVSYLLATRATQMVTSGGSSEFHILI